MVIQSYQEVNRNLRLKKQITNPTFSVEVSVVHSVHHSVTRLLLAISSYSYREGVEVANEAAATPEHLEELRGTCVELVWNRGG